MQYVETLSSRSVSPLLDRGNLPFSPGKSLKLANKQLLQQAILIAGLRSFQTPLAHPFAVAAARLGTVFVMAPTQGVAHFRLKPLLDDQRRHGSQKFTETGLRRQTVLDQITKTIMRAFNSGYPIRLQVSTAEQNGATAAA